MLLEFHALVMAGGRGIWRRFLEVCGKSMCMSQKGRERSQGKHVILVLIAYPNHFQIFQIMGHDFFFKVSPEEGGGGGEIIRFNLGIVFKNSFLICFFDFKTWLWSPLNPGRCNRIFKMVWNGIFSGVIFYLFHRSSILAVETRNIQSNELSQPPWSREPVGMG